MAGLGDSLDELARGGVGGICTPPDRRRSPHPPGWEPHVEQEGDRATAVSQPTVNADPDERQLIEGWGLDPDVWQIDGPLNVRRWQANMGRDPDSGKVTVEWMHYYKANLVRRVASTRASLDELVAEIRRWKPPKRKPPTGDVALVVNLADWQIGCGDGDGTAGSVRRILDAGAQVEARVVSLRRDGVKVGALYVAGLGDLVEGCKGWYDQQSYTVDLNQREQGNVVRRLLVGLLKRWARLVDEMVVLTVPGNHGENRQGSKARGGVTDDADNTDVAVFEQVREVLAENPALAHVRFVIPHDEQAVTVDVAGTAVAWAHGHRSDGRGKAPLSHWAWWKDQIAAELNGMHLARVLNVGHLHHLIVYEPTFGKTILQAPPMDGGSKYFADSYGGRSVPGTLTYTVDSGGWDRLWVARAVLDWRNVA